MKKIIIVLLAVALVGFTSCHDWLDVNHNPNAATTISYKLVLPGVLAQWGNDMTDFSACMGGWMGYWSHAGGWSGWYAEKKYEITSSYNEAYNNTFYAYYLGPLADTKYIRDNAGDNLVYPAITDVVDAWYYSRLVDVFGDVPYSEACQGGANLTPKYDKAQDIYNDLIARLDNAITVFQAAAADPSNSIYTVVKTGDVVYNGDFAKWAKLANTLKLRLVVRMTNVYSATELKAMMDNSASVGFIAQNATVNPGYAASASQQMPMWDSYGQSYNGVNRDQNTEYILNAYFHKMLTKYSDPRLTAWFFAPLAANGKLYDIPFGTDGDLTVQYNSTIAANYTWKPIAADAKVVTTSTKIYNSGNGATNPSIIFPLSEADFLQAEAQARGILSGTAGTSYTAGITASLTDAGITATNQSDYITQTTVAWDDNQTLAQKVEKIITQKWISNYFWNHFESWNDYRRTSYPNPKGLGADCEMLSYYPSGIIRRQIPRLFLYPANEFTLNYENVQAAVDAQKVQFTSAFWPFDARVFWDTAPTTITY